MNFAVVDIETVNNHTTSVATIGIVGVDKGKIIETSEFSVRPEPFEFEAEAVAINGLKKDDFINAPSFPEIWTDLLALFSKYDFLVAHNAPFDFGILKSCCEFYNLSSPDFPVLDSLAYSRKSDINAPNHRLDTLCNCLDISLTKHHSALYDAIATAEILLKLIDINRDNIIDVFFKGNIQYFSEHKTRNAVGIGRTSKTSNTSYNSNWNLKAIDVEAADIYFNKSNPFFEKKVVISGDLYSLPRKEAYSLLKALGAEVSDNITLSTNYLITNAVTETGKIKKAMDYIKRGIDIKIINEREFIQIMEASYGTN